MLAQLLRRILVSQVLLGAGLGYAWAHCGNATWLWVPALALALPVGTLLFVDVLSAFTSRAGEGVAVWWRALVGEYWAGLVIFIGRQPWTWGTPPWKAAPAEPTANTSASIFASISAKIPVILVHGYLCNHRIWDDQVAHLHAQGHATLAVNLEPLFTSIDDYAASVHTAVEALRQHTGARQVALVGHSMGGLAIRAYVRAHGASAVARIITLGTPHVGTQVLFNDRTPNGLQMQWNSTWLQALAAQETPALRALMRIAITPQDNIVYPQRAQVLPGVSATIFSGIGHVQMCTHPPVLAWVCAQVQDLPLHTT